MPTEVITIRLPKENDKYAAECAAQLGMKKTPFLQSLVEKQLAILRKEPMPEKVTEKVTEKKRRTPSPRRSSFWRRYKALIKSHVIRASMLGDADIELRLIDEQLELMNQQLELMNEVLLMIDETLCELDAHLEEYPETFLECVDLKIQILRHAHEVSNTFKKADAKEKADAEKNTVIPEEIREMVPQLTGFKLKELDRLLHDIQLGAKS